MKKQTLWWLIGGVAVYYMISRPQPTVISAAGQFRSAVQLPGGQMLRMLPQPNPAAWAGSTYGWGSTPTPVEVPFKPGHSLY